MGCGATRQSEIDEDLWITTAEEAEMPLPFVPQRCQKGK